MVKKAEENGLLNVYIDSRNEFIQITSNLVFQLISSHPI